MVFTHRYASPLGGITMASDGEALTGLWFDGQKFFPPLSGHEPEEVLPVFEQSDRWLDTYFGGKAPDFTPFLRLNSTPFRNAVWEILLTVPFGRTVTYGEIAKEVAKRKTVPSMSAQAVGGAVGHNPVSLIVPCHRVIGANGNLTGYAGGIERKIRLLNLEGADMAGLFIPYEKKIGRYRNNA